MDESFVIVSNTELNNNSFASVETIDSGSEDDKKFDNTSWYAADESNSSIVDQIRIEKPHDINDAYDFNVQSMMPILTEKKSSVINVAKINSQTVIADDTAKTSNRSEIIKVLHDKKNSVINIAKSENENQNLSDKLRAIKGDENKEKISQVKTVDDAYVNDTSDMGDFLKILNNKKNSIISMAKVDADEALIMADSAKNKQKSKQLAAVFAANEEDLNLISVSKKHNQLNKIGSNSIDISDDYDYKKLNEVKAHVNKNFFDENQSDSQKLVETLKKNKKAFLENILD